MKSFFLKWRWGLGLIGIFLFGLAACTPVSEPITATAVPPSVTAVAQIQPSATAPPTETATLLPPATETAVPPTAQPISTQAPSATNTPEPTQTPFPTPPRPSIILPAQHDFLERAAALPYLVLGDIIDFQAVPDNPNILKLVTTDFYFLIDVTTAEVTTVSALPNTRIVGVDNAGIVWLVPKENSNTIIALAQDSSQQTFNADDGWQPFVGIPKDLLQDASGHVWLTTNEDVRRFDGTRWTVFTREAMNMAPPELDEVSTIFSLAYSPLTQTVWVGECDWIGPGPTGGGGARWFNGDIWQGAGSPADNGCVTDVVEAGNGRIWIALDNHLLRFHPADSSWQQFTPPNLDDNYRIGYTEKLVLDNQDNPWPLFSLCGGASCMVGYVQFRLRDEVWTQFGDVFFDPIQIVFNSDNLPIFLFQRQMSFYTLGDEQIFYSGIDLETVAVWLDDADNIWIVGRPSDDIPFIIWTATMRG